MRNRLAASVTIAAIALLPACTDESRGASTPSTSAAADGWALLRGGGDSNIPADTAGAIQEIQPTDVVEGTVVGLIPGRVLTYGEGRDGTSTTAFLEVRASRSKDKKGESKGERTVFVEVMAPPQIASSPKDFEGLDFGREPKVLLVTTDISTLATSFEWLDPTRKPDEWVRTLHVMAILEATPEGGKARSLMTDSTLPYTGSTTAELFDDLSSKLAAANP